MNLDDDEPIELPKRDLRGLYIGLVVLVVSGLLYSQREHFPMILDGRYVPFVGEVYSFPGDVTPATEEGAVKTLELFNKPWVEMFLIEQKARLQGACDNIRGMEYYTEQKLRAKQVIGQGGRAG